MIEPSLLDTDILSDILKGRNQVVTDNADAYLKLHGRFAISDFTRFEVVRGLRWQKATAKLTSFDRLCQSMIIFPVTAKILDRAAELWADGASQGKPKMDADLIIAATALIHGRVLVTGNVGHFGSIRVSCG
ncbi:tRNA(fMet)-specific endonuclease VapC [Pirellulimonas nuda]|uniref:tRNA(fMet)-specific endonuclease VapC n=1 Tax=Pirellulimonas nuda TaxID=2528009 RepID=A0A518DJX8_9BACT|nr:PIN domain-containing protein [Pirellulimonas nuda]QDU91779.1 tRNA(fMet)-specific endonuclease VapC [Pirellulimonas nuda]